MNCTPVRAHYWLLTAAGGGTRAGDAGFLYVDGVRGSRRKQHGAEADDCEGACAGAVRVVVSADGLARHGQIFSRESVGRGWRISSREATQAGFAAMFSTRRRRTQQAPVDGNPDSGRPRIAAYIRRYVSDGEDMAL
ncbi:hypothetical protein BU26DRAFT_35742 [Trematosphaeria pertusa]|uniref:Uncharacterized protein n=1 Tax=Trematosphaeria pertusa TaxID=390896 RepID=A0A6A6J6F4_9PLEO|nr:uncharacterized protein BU26DRAFT_35742 [Trematosphaeria pertusa]KAF2257073.1 hypothetical protein BU26DRAFT_35742 [Trematosphaeria pertusa]